MSEHTQEPWPSSGNRGKWMPGGVWLPEADYARARACVNALAGVEDPERFVKAHGKMLKALRDYTVLHLPIVHAAIADATCKEVTS